jgi:hypothetical protein
MPLNKTTTVVNAAGVAAIIVTYLLGHSNCFQGDMPSWAYQVVMAALGMLNTVLPQIHKPDEPLVDK